jgi:hypothetical protein
VEQGTHKPLDVGSNPTLATNILSSPYFWDGLGETTKTCLWAGFFIYDQDHYTKQRLSPNKRIIRG